MRLRHPTYAMVLLTIGLAVSAAVVGCRSTRDLDHVDNLQKLRWLSPDGPLPLPLALGCTLGNPLDFDTLDRFEATVECQELGQSFRVFVVTRSGEPMGMVSTAYFDILTGHGADGVPQETLVAILSSLRDLLDGRGTAGALAYRLHGAGHLAFAWWYDWYGSGLSVDGAVPFYPHAKPLEEQPLIWSVPLLEPLLLPLWVATGLGLALLAAWLLRRRRPWTAPPLDDTAPDALIGPSTATTLLVISLAVGVLLRLAMAVTPIPDWSWSTDLVLPFGLDTLTEAPAGYFQWHPPLPGWLTAGLVTILPGADPATVVHWVSAASSVVALLALVSAASALFRDRLATVLVAVVVGILPLELDVIAYNEPYALSHAMVALAVWAFARFVRRGSDLDLGLWVLLSAAVPWTSYPKAVILPAMAAMVLVGLGRSPRRLAIVPWSVGVLFLVAPLVGLVLHGMDTYQGHLLGDALGSASTATPGAPSLASGDLASIIAPASLGSGMARGLLFGLTGVLAAWLLVHLVRDRAKHPSSLLVVGLVILLAATAALDVVMPLRMANMSSYPALCCLALVGTTAATRRPPLRLAGALLVLVLAVARHVAIDPFVGSFLN